MKVFMPNRAIALGGAARVAGVFESIRETYASDPDTLVATLDVGGYFFGSALFFPYNKGASSVRARVLQPAAMLASCLYLLSFHGE